MSRTNKKHLGIGWILVIILLPLFDFILFIRYLVQGKNIALLHPKGLVAEQQHSLMVFVVLVLLCIAIPALFILFFTAWKFRESNSKVLRSNDGRHGRIFDVVLWLIPMVILLILVSTMLPATHKYVPRQEIASDAKPLKIQVISLRWKWLFLYPDHKIATVNYLQIPANTPVHFELTADETPMSSFWIPNLSGQLYTMTGHVNRLHIMSNEIGDYPGSTAELNGAGFAGMKFNTRVTSADEFKAWVKAAKQQPNTLDQTTYNSLAQPSENNQKAIYGAYYAGLYDRVVSRYNGASGGHTHGQ